MLPYSAADALHSMTSTYGLTLDPPHSHPRQSRPSRIARWLRSLLPLA